MNTITLRKAYGHGHGVGELLVGRTVGRPQLLAGCVPDDVRADRRVTKPYEFEDADLPGREVELMEVAVSTAVAPRFRTTDLARNPTSGWRPFRLDSIDMTADQEVVLSIFTGLQSRRVQRTTLWNQIKSIK